MLILTPVVITDTLGNAWGWESALRGFPRPQGAVRSWGSGLEGGSLLPHLHGHIRVGGARPETGAQQPTSGLENHRELLANAAMPQGSLRLRVGALTLKSKSCSKSEVSRGKRTRKQPYFCTLLLYSPSK